TGNGWFTNWRSEMRMRLMVVPAMLLVLAAAGCAKRPATSMASAPALSGAAGSTGGAMTPAAVAGPAPSSGGSSTSGSGMSRAATATARPQPGTFRAVPELNDIYFDFDKYEIRSADVGSSRIPASAHHGGGHDHQHHPRLHSHRRQGRYGSRRRPARAERFAPDRGLRDHRRAECDRRPRPDVQRGAPRPGDAPPLARRGPSENPERALRPRQRAGHAARRRVRRHVQDRRGRGDGARASDGSLPAGPRAVAL